MSDRHVICLSMVALFVAACVSISFAAAEHAVKFARSADPVPCRQVPVTAKTIYDSLGKSKLETVVSKKWKILPEQVLHRAQLPPTNVLRTGQSIARQGNGGGGVAYSTFIGGSDVDRIVSVLPGMHRNTIILGQTGSSDFPTTERAYARTLSDPMPGGYTTDAFIMSMATETGELEYSSLFGGNSSEIPEMVLSNSRGWIVIAGTTRSTNLPTSDSSWQRTHSGVLDCFVAVFDSTASNLIGCIYLGGSGIENLWGAAIDEEDNIYIIGLTDSPDFPVTANAFQKTYGGGDDDVFISKLSPTCTTLLGSTFIGGSGWDEGYNVHLMPNGDLLACGYSMSDNFPTTPDALYPSKISGDEGVVMILSNALDKLEYSTYIAWDMHEQVQDVAIDSEGVITVFGCTSSSDLPVHETAFQQHKGEYPVYRGLYFDYYLMRFDYRKSEILACTYLGGSGDEYKPQQMATVEADRFAVAGYSHRSDFPYTSYLTGLEGGPIVMLVAVLNASLSELIYAPQIGGSGIESLDAVASSGNQLILGGLTYSTDYPVTQSAFQSELRGSDDGVLTVLQIPDSTVASFNSQQLPVADRLSQNYPNPARGLMTIDYLVGTAGIVELSIYDVLGRCVKRVINGHVDAGRYSVAVSTLDICPGIYMSRLTTERTVQSKTIIVVR